MNAKHRGWSRASFALLVATSALAACLGELEAPTDPSPAFDATTDASTSGDGMVPTDASPHADADADAALTYFQEVMADKPLAYWRFDEDAGSTVAYDSSGNGNTLTFGGSDVELGVKGALANDTDTALTLNASALLPSYADGGSIFSFTGNAAFTFEFWAKVSTDQGGYVEILGRTDSNTPPGFGYNVSITPNKCVTPNWSTAFDRSAEARVILALSTNVGRLQRPSRFALPSLPPAPALRHSVGRLAAAVKLAHEFARRLKPRASLA
jgi:hypothetical protein